MLFPFIVSKCRDRAMRHHTNPLSYYCMCIVRGCDNKIFNLTFIFPPRATLTFVKSQWSIHHAKVDKGWSSTLTWKQPTILPLRVAFQLYYSPSRVQYAPLQNGKKLSFFNLPSSKCVKVSLDRVQEMMAQKVKKKVAHCHNTELTWIHQEKQFVASTAGQFD